MDSVFHVLEFVGIFSVSWSWTEKVMFYTVTVTKFTDSSYIGLPCLKRTRPQVQLWIGWKKKYRCQTLAINPDFVAWRVHLWCHRLPTGFIVCLTLMQNFLLPSTLLPQNLMPFLKKKFKKIINFRSQYEKWRYNTQCFQWWWSWNKDRQWLSQCDAGRREN